MEHTVDEIVLNRNNPVSGFERSSLGPKSASGFWTFSEYLSRFINCNMSRMIDGLPFSESLIQAVQSVVEFFGPCGPLGRGSVHSREQRHFESDELYCGVTHRISFFAGGPELAPRPPGRRESIDLDQVNRWFSAKVTMELLFSLMAHA